MNPNLNTTPVKLLCLCDSPTVHTGFGNVSRNLIRRWLPLCERIDVWGVNYGGTPHSWPCRIWPAALASAYNQWNTAHNLTRFINHIGTSDYTHLWILMDCHQLSGGNFPEYLQKICQAKKVRTIFYYPVDAALEAKWLDAVAVCDQAVTYTEYARQETCKASPKLKPAVVGHGADTAIYRPLPDRMGLRHQWFRNRKAFKNWLADDDFLILNVNRNERRKAPQHSLAIMQQLAQRGVKAKLLLHCPDRALDEGTHLTLIGRQLGLEYGKHWRHHEEAFVNYNGQLTEPEMNELYNCADLVLSTSTGEGWGLSLSEGAASGCRVAAPDHTSCREIIQTLNTKQGLFAEWPVGPHRILPIAPQCQVNMLDTSRVRYPVDVLQSADVVQQMIAEGPQRHELTAASADWLSWDRLAAQMFQLIVGKPQ